MRRFTTRDLTLAAAIAAVYAALTLSLPIPQYHGVQLRAAEALTVLPFLFPAAIPGLTVGCFLANLLGSPFVLDWIFGTLATFLAAVLTRRMPSRWLAPLPPVAWSASMEGAAFLPAFALNALTVGLGELVACYVLGSLLLAVLPRVPYIRQLAPRTPV